MANAQKNLIKTEVEVRAMSESTYIYTYIR